MSAPSTKFSTTEKTFEGLFLSACGISALGGGVLLSFYGTAFVAFKDWIDAVISTGLLCTSIGLLLWVGAAFFARTWPRRLVIVALAVLAVLAAWLGFNQALAARRDLGLRDDSEPFRFTFRPLPIVEAITVGEPSVP